MVFCWIVLQFSSRLFKVTYLSHAMCHVLSATLDQLLTTSINQSINQSINLLTSMRGMGLPRSSEPEAHVLLSSTVRILKSSRIYESVIKYNVRETMSPILFRLRPLWKCYLTCLNWTYCWSKFKAELNSGGVLPKMAYTKRLHSTIFRL